ncbi:MAG: RidA family protein [Rhodospirillaceae bacterium]|nr:RidA family protein [Rhodospirillaceae bacterium]
MTTIQRFDTGPRMSQAVVHGDTIYLAGQVNKDVANVTGQTVAILKQIDDLLARAGSAKQKTLSATIYLADIKSFPDMNKAWDAWVPAGHCPARTTVEAKLAAPEYLVEITVVAGK